MVGELPAPKAGDGEVLVQVRASGINPSDTKQRAGWRGAKPAFPRIVPHADVVVKLGAEKFTMRDLGLVADEYRSIEGAAVNEKHLAAVVEARLQGIITGQMTRLSAVQKLIDSAVESKTEAIEVSVLLSTLTGGDSSDV